MAKQIEWGITKKERLFQVAAKYAESFAAAPYVIDENTEVIRNIHATFGDNSSDARAVLFQLAAMKFVKSKGDSRKSVIFYRQDPDFQVDNFTISVDYPAVSQDELKAIVGSIPDHYAAGCADVPGLWAAGGRTELNYRKILHDNGVTELAANIFDVTVFITYDCCPGFKRSQPIFC